jgi:hypothetical protein
LATAAVNTSAENTAAVNTAAVSKTLYHQKQLSYSDCICSSLVTAAVKMAA